jgi:hypothetical protein
MTVGGMLSTDAKDDKDCEHKAKLYAGHCNITIPSELITDSPITVEYVRDQSLIIICADLNIPQLDEH